MQTPTATGQDSARFTVETDEVDGIIRRRITCTHPIPFGDGMEPCGATAEGSSSWALGVVDRPTHVFALRVILDEQCEWTDCPHHARALAAKGSR